MVVQVTGFRSLYASRSARIGRSVRNGGVAFSADDELLAVSGAKAINVLRAKDGSLLQTIANETYRPIAFLPDGRSLAVAGPGRIQIWNSRTGTLERRLDTNIDDVGSTLQWRGESLVYATDSKLQIWHRKDLRARVADRIARAWSAVKVAASPFGSAEDLSSPTAAVRAWLGAIERKDGVAYERALSPRLRRTYEKAAAAQGIPIAQLYRLQMANMSADVTSDPATCCEEIKGVNASVKRGDMYVDVVKDGNVWLIDAPPHEWKSP